MNGRATPGAEMNTSRLTNVIPERIIFVSRGITVYHNAWSSECQISREILSCVGSWIEYQQTSNYSSDISVPLIGQCPWKLPDWPAMCTFYCKIQY